jgi:oligoendopeptidase F
MKTDWNLGLLFKDEKEILLERKIVEEKTNAFVKKWEGRDDYLKDPKVLKLSLDEYNEWASKWGAGTRENYYYHLKSSLDQNDPKIKAALNKVEEFGTKLENSMQFFSLRVSKIDKKLQPKFLKEKELLPYKHYLEKLFLQSEHLLSEPEEKILNSVSPLTYSNWTRMVSGFLAKEEREVLDEKGKKATKTFSEITSLTSSTNKKVRDTAAQAFNDITAKHVESAENEINAILQYKKLSDELRHYDRPDISRHMSDDIDTEVVGALIVAVTKRFDIAKKYYALKAKLLGIKKLAYHERNVPYGKLDKKYTYEEAKDLVMKVFTDLDNEFAMIFSKFQEEGNIDVYPKKGKQSGAYAAVRTLNTPTYILLNHTEKLNDVLTLAHELGHGINNELMRARENELNYDTPTSTAEVASTFMEDFVLQELEKGIDDETRLSLQMMKLNDDISTIFRQIACYNLETDLHTAFREKGYLSKEVIGEIFQKNMKAYMGDAVEQSSGSENWWVYWSHIRYFFYVYSYSSGLLISKSLQAEVKKDPKFILKVKEFLASGMSDSPKNIFAKLGLDITKKSFWDKGLDEVEELLKETEKLAKKLKKI